MIILIMTKIEIGPLKGIQILPMQMLRVFEGNLKTLRLIMKIIVGTIYYR